MREILLFLLIFHAKSVYSNDNATITWITPHIITDIEARDGINLTISGSGFSAAAALSDVLCYFEGISNKTVQASSLHDTAITCQLSDYINNTFASIYISLDNGLNWFNTPDNGQIFLYIFSDCGSMGCIYGQCRYNTCYCIDGYQGETCNQCVDEYFQSGPGGACYNCSLFCMNNGTCKNHTCVCRQGFEGVFCSICTEHRYGANCSANPVVVNVSPDRITDIEARDGIDLILSVDNVNITDISSAICNFQTLFNWTTQASFINRTTAICRLVNYTDSYPIIHIRLSLDNSTTWIEPAFGSLYVSVNRGCPSGGCLYGQCQFNSCSCYDGYQGETCDQCLDGYFQSTPSGACYNCSIDCMNNGTCTNHTCVCRQGFAGDFCSYCAEHHYGANCSANPVVLSVDPSTITDIQARDGIDIRVNVDNVIVSNASTLVCRFRSFVEQIVNAVLVNETTVLCTLSNITSVYGIDVSVSLDNGSNWIEGVNWYTGRISISPDCGNNSCDNGYCSFGSCVCYQGYNGSSCDQCGDGYFVSSYGWCMKCSDYCSTNGECRNRSCVCADRFTGLGCSTCIPHHYGANCTQYPVMLVISPNWVTDTASRDGVNITIYGDNLNFTDPSQVLCRFQSTLNYTVQALDVSNSSIICYLSNHNDLTSLKLTASLDNGTTWLPVQYDNYYYSYINIYPDCGKNSCPYGRCSYGECLCISDSNYIGVSPFRGPVYGGYPITLYGICFNDSSYTVRINNQQINDCQADSSTLVCTMPMIDEGLHEIQLFNSTGLVRTISFHAFLPKDDLSSILVNDLEINNRIWFENDTDEITLHFRTTSMTVNYLCQITIFDYSTPIGDGNQTETTANFSRRQLDLGLGLMNLSDIRNFTISRDFFLSNNSSSDTFHGLGVKFEMFSEVNRRRYLRSLVAAVFGFIPFLKPVASTYCLGWSLLQSDENTKKIVDEVPPCPRRVVTTWPQQAVGFIADEACDGSKSGGGNCDFHPGATGCYRAQSTTSDAGAQCCYDSEGDWIQSGKGAGTVDAVSSEKSVLRHIMSDVVPFVACCYREIVFGTDCEHYTKHRPAGNSIDITLVPIRARGDPHFTILNGESYTFNGHGEYVLLKVSNIELEIQVRLAAMTNASATTGDTATAIVAFVVQLKNQSRVQFDLISQSKAIDIRVDGRLLDSPTIVNESLSSKIFSDDHQLTIRRESSTKYHISYGQTGVDIDVNIRPEFDFLDLPILIVRSVLESATCQGLLGDLQGLIFPNGTRVQTEALDDEERMFEYGETWRVTENSTLFTYALFDSYAQRQDFNYKPVFRADLFNRYNNTNEYRTAEEKCQNLTKREDCMYDILIMKDPTIADSQKASEETQKTWILYNQLVQADINSTTSTSSTSATSTSTSITITSSATSGGTTSTSSTSATSTSTSITVTSSATSGGTTSTSSTSATSTSAPITVTSSATSGGTTSTSSTSATSTSTPITVTSSAASTSTPITVTSSATSAGTSTTASTTVTSSTVSSTLDASSTTSSTQTPATTTIRGVFIELTPLSDYCK